MTSGCFIHPSVRPFFYLHAIYQGIEVAEERRQFLATRRLPNSVFSGEHSMNCHEDFAQAKSLEDPRACPQSVPSDRRRDAVSAGDAHASGQAK